MRQDTLEETTVLDTHVAQSAIDHAVSLGADFAEVFVERNQVNNIATLSNQVRDIASGIDFGVGIRLVYGHKVLYGYTNRTDTAELKRIVSELAAKDRRDPAVTAQAFDFRTAPDIHGAQRTLTEGAEVRDKVDYLFAADRAARASSNLISQTQGACGQREQAVEIFNSDGVHIRDTRHYIRARIEAVASNGSDQATGMRTDGGLQGWEIVETLDSEECGAEAARQALVNLSAKPCPSGRMPVVIGNGFGGVIFHEACGHLLETTSVAKKASVFHDKLGEMIANPVVNAVDDGTLAREWGSINIDDEGHAHRAHAAHQGRQARQLPRRPRRRRPDRIAPHRIRSTPELPVRAGLADAQHLHRTGHDQLRRHDRVHRPGRVRLAHGRGLGAARHRGVQLRRDRGLLRRGRQNSAPGEGRPP